MKNRFLLLLLALCFSGSLFAQFTPQGFNYQSIVRDAGGTALMNQTVTLLFVIRSGAANGPVAYSEKQATSTNQYGLVNLIIGQGGTPLQGDFGAINWGGGAKFLTVSVETSPSVFDELGSSQLMSVPYALYAQNSANGGSGGSDNWGTQTAQTNATLSGNGTGGSPLAIAQQGAASGQVLKWDGNKWSPADDINSTIMAVRLPKLTPETALRAARSARPAPSAWPIPALRPAFTAALRKFRSFPSTRKAASPAYLPRRCNRGRSAWSARRALRCSKMVSISP